MPLLRTLNQMFAQLCCRHCVEDAAAASDPFSSANANAVMAALSAAAATTTSTDQHKRRGCVGVAANSSSGANSSSADSSSSKRDYGKPQRAPNQRKMAQSKEIVQWAPCTQQARVL
jgi:hypothetical protein